MISSDWNLGIYFGYTSYLLSLLVINRSLIFERNDFITSKRPVPLSEYSNETIAKKQTSQQSLAYIGDSDESNGINVKLKRQVTRAKLVHQKTFALYDKHLNAFYECMESHLFDRALIVNLVKRNEMNCLPYENIRCDYVPCVAYIYPERNNENLIESHNSQTDCPDLFIPDFTRAKAFIESDRWPGDEEFTLTLTDESGKRLAFAANVLQEIFLLSKYLFSIFR
ncbi:unnamed protein product [Onchocerca flexuosa]|uniref:Uncharacterized protein n=1 Tax=Onchocerca flexuosa TaxID=387005 RepID=A0A183HJB3_9BILA|nr:unnamed protein product [Onchocerca flexuosa]